MFQTQCYGMYSLQFYYTFLDDESCFSTEKKNNYSEIKFKDI